MLSDIGGNVTRLCGSADDSAPVSDEGEGVDTGAVSEEGRVPVIGGNLGTLLLVSPLVRGTVSESGLGLGLTQ